MEARLAQLDRASASGAEGGSGRRPKKKTQQSHKIRKLAFNTAWRDDRCAACGAAVVWAPYAMGGSVALHPEPVAGGKYCLPLANGNRSVHSVRPGNRRPTYSLAYVGHSAVCGVLK